MTPLPNLAIYRNWAPVYDCIFRPITHRARKETVRLLSLHPGERLLIPGVGTGLDLPLIPAGVHVTGVDISPEMLERAKAKTGHERIALSHMNAQNLKFEDECFDAVLFNLVLSVVPDGRAAFGEAWRVLRTGGRIAIFDKFLPEDQPLTPFRRALGRLISFFGTDPNRRLSEILEGQPGLDVAKNIPGLLSGQYRIVRIEKTGVAGSRL